MQSTRACLIWLMPLYKHVCCYRHSMDIGKLKAACRIVFEVFVSHDMISNECCARQELQFQEYVLLGCCFSGTHQRRTIGIVLSADAHEHFKTKNQQRENANQKRFDEKNL